MRWSALLHTLLISARADARCDPADRSAHLHAAAQQVDAGYGEA